MKWLGTESNRRHADFQSAALPTELPSRKPRNLTAPPTPFNPFTERGLPPRNAASFTFPVAQLGRRDDLSPTVGFPRLACRTLRQPPEPNGPPARLASHRPLPRRRNLPRRSSRGARTNPGRPRVGPQALDLLRRDFTIHDHATDTRWNA